MKGYLQRLYLYSLAIALKEAHADTLEGLVDEKPDHYLVSLCVKVPKQDEPPQSNFMQNLSNLRS